MQARQAFAKRSRLAIAVFNPSRVSGFSSQENLGKFSGKDAAALQGGFRLVFGIEALYAGVFFVLKKLWKSFKASRD